MCGQRDTYFCSAFRQRPKLERLSVIHARQSFFGCTEPDSEPQFCRVRDRETRTVVTDGENKVIALIICFEHAAHPDYACLVASSDAMPDRILYQRLQQQIWNQRPLRLSRDIEEHRQPIAMTNLLDRNIVPGKRHLFTERNLV